MTDTETTMTETPTAAPVATPVAAAIPGTDARGPRGAAPRGRGGPGDRRGGGRGRERAPRERSEFDQATIDVRRVARVMAGGRRFSFSVTVVIGDRKGRVGVGIGKGADTALSIDKAVRDAKKHLITVKRTKTNSIRHDVTAIDGPSVISIMPSPGRGLVAGSAMRTVLEYAGVTDVIAKILSRSKNKLSLARATVMALKSLRG